MKKVLSLTMAALLAFSLTACGNSGSSAPAADVSESSSASAQETGAEAGEAENSGAAESTDAAESASSESSDLAAIQEKGTLVVGITNFEPMDYQDENGDWIGFDADLAKQFAEYLGVSVEFSEIT